jgi:hypothetical protein
VPEHQSSELTYAQLDEAVARECLGATVDAFSDPKAERLITVLEHDRLMLTALPRDIADPRRTFSPTSDARDAERVWNWLISEPMSEVHITRYAESGNQVGIYRESAGGQHELGSDATCNWKRTLCLAALAVARKGKS